MQCDPAASQLGGHPYPGGVVEDSPTASQAMTGSTLDTKQLGRFRCMPPPTGRRKQRLVMKTSLCFPGQDSCFSCLGVLGRQLGPESDGPSSLWPCTPGRWY